MDADSGEHLRLSQKILLRVGRTNADAANAGSGGGDLAAVHTALLQKARVSFQVSIDVECSLISLLIALFSFSDRLSFFRDNQ
jgi:hypothetical protein